MLTAAVAAELAGGRLIQGDGATAITGFGWDSRQVRAGQLFIAVRGERVDGHEYVAAAVAAGAMGALVGRPVASPGVLILVDDPVLALGRMGAAWLRRYPVPVVGITGSVGKTTTKEMAWAVLSQRFKTLRNLGNLNSEIGLPVTLFELDESYQAAVLEMGMRAKGEIRHLVGIAPPSVAVVTNVGLSHLELLGSQAAIAEAKAELVQGLRPGGTAVLNADDPRVAAMHARTPGPVTFYGIGLTPGRAAALRGGGPAGWVGAFDLRPAGTPDAPATAFRLAGHAGEAAVLLPAPGEHNVLGALGAAGAGLALGLSPAEAAAGLAHYAPAGNRMRIRRAGSWRLLDDTYNAAPDSTVAALKVLRELAGGGRAVAVLGSMYELGAAAAAGHRRVGEAAAACADLLVCVGEPELAGEVPGGARAAGLPADRVHYFATKVAAAAALPELLRRNDTILVKGSRGMQMEEIVALLENIAIRFV